MRSVGAAFFGLCLVLEARASAATAWPRDDAKASSETVDRCTGSFTAIRPKPEDCLDAIETDRPHKTDSPKVLEPGHAQIEMGVVEYGIERVGASSDNSLAVMNNIYKLGVTDRIDVEVLHGAGSYAMRSKRFSLGSQMTIRSKLNVLDGKGRPFALTLVPVLIVPIAAVPIDAGGFVFIGGTLPADVELEVNLGGASETDTGGSRRTIAPVITAALTRRLLGPISGFVEWYNDTTIANLGKWNATADAGLLWLVKKNVQLDAGAYVRMWGDAPMLTPFLGLSVRL